MQASKLLIKYGGNAMINASLQNKIAEVIYKLKSQGHQVCVVHGGGPFINQSLSSADITSEFIQGQRKTSPEAMSEIQKTLIGEVNANLVVAFNKAGAKAVGLSGLDANMVVTTPKEVQIQAENGSISIAKLGRVGEISNITPGLTEHLMQSEYVPLIACVAADSEGNSMNVNADDFAGAMAAAIQADFYISLTDVDGLYEDYPNPDSIISSISLNELPSLYGQIIQGGMIPKIQSCEKALRHGVKNVLILNGTKPQQLEDFFNKGIKSGTTLTH
ncbi:MAG: acetylglutamate kinase [Mongoliibacter sp.]|uniref:acetylglutamate kinase n=1 Tax=Mongoliibacter sp. TaxID=2022438 RepID=UPI0012F444E6|nr:acetylglutamate kinase [Mongoliibacter sp.]TVP52953.1 MAG: acetylglutamate kinase [Mongoliibacter sp.]